MADDDYCFRHSPETAEAAVDASRLGGLRRRKEQTLQHVYEYDGISTPEGVRRLLEVAATEALALPNSVNRVRALTYIAWVAMRAIEDQELARQIEELRGVLRRRQLEAGR